ncbi:MAG: non-homologous end-joining DNA ligase [Candidatus Aenigmarchaeota archaeon]|nr:non-homologous end-joining DNA ligase [Candidatus Aenigmarchaeota archaeon]
MSLWDQTIKPMLAKLGSREDLKRKDLIFEPKLDGTRALLFKKDNSIKIINRRNMDITYRYPELLETINNISANSATLDGEIIVLDKTGKRPDFYRLAEREHVDSKLRIEILSKEMPATYVVFDILSVNNRDLTNLLLLERKKILKEVVSESTRINLCFFTENGEELFKVVKKQRLEGVMGKVKDSLYLIGKRSEYWLKIKSLKTLDCIICGYTVGTGWRQKYFGALILGCYYQNKLRYVGRVGTGLDEKGYAELTEKLQKLKTDKCPFKEKPELPLDIIPVWVKPKLVCEVKFMNLSKNKIMRAPSFIRLREDKSLKDCLLEI